MAKFTIIKKEAADGLMKLYETKKDNSYIVVDVFNEYSTIFQYSAKYNQVKMISVKTENLNPTDRLQEA